MASAYHKGRRRFSFFVAARRYYVHKIETVTKYVSLQVWLTSRPRVNIVKSCMGPRVCLKISFWRKNNHVHECQPLLRNYNQSSCNLYHVSNLHVSLACCLNATFLKGYQLITNQIQGVSVISL